MMTEFSLLFSLFLHIKEIGKNINKKLNKHNMCTLMSFQSMRCILTIATRGAIAHISINTCFTVSFYSLQSTDMEEKKLLNKVVIFVKGVI